MERVDFARDIVVPNSKIERFAVALIFLFPLFVVSIRHWASGIFILLSALGIAALFLRTTYAGIARNEWFLMALIAAFFGSHVLTSLANGWDDLATDALNTELRYLLFVPLYLVIRRSSSAVHAFFWGCLFSVFLNFGFVLHEVEMLGRQQVHLVYSSLLVGPVTVIFAGVAILGWRLEKKWVEITVKLLALSAALYVSMHTSRSAIVGVLVLLLMTSFFYVKKKRFLVAALILVVAAAAIWSNDFSRKRVDLAFDELKNYVEYEYEYESAQMPNKYGGGSVGTRLEMLKSAKIVLNEAPWVGFGRYHYQDRVKEEVRKQGLHPGIAGHGHPHNIFVATLFFKGLVGLFVVVAIFVYALLQFGKSLEWHHVEARAGIAFVILLLMTQLTESALFIKGNFIAVFLVGMAVLYSAINRSQSMDHVSEQSKGA